MPRPGMRLYALVALLLTLTWPTTGVCQDPPGIIPPRDPRPPAPTPRPSPPPKPEPSPEPAPDPEPTPAPPGNTGGEDSSSPGRPPGRGTDRDGSGRPEIETSPPRVPAPIIDSDLVIDPGVLIGPDILIDPDLIILPDGEGVDIDDVLILDDPMIVGPGPDGDRNRPWGNPEGYLELREHLTSHGFTHLVQIRISRLDDGRLMACLPDELAGLGVPLAIGVVSESRTDDVDLSAFGVHGQDERGRLLGVDEGPELTAAVGVHPTTESSRWCFEASTKGVASNERLMILVASTVGMDWPEPDQLIDQGGWRVDPTPAMFDPTSVDPDRPIVVIPIHGTFGVLDPLDPEFFTSVDFRNAVETAIGRNPSLIVLEFDTPGGRVDTKDEMLRTMLAEIDDGVRFIATIKDAISCGAMLAFGCEFWLATPDARIGAAVMYREIDGSAVSVREEHKDPQVRAKFESVFNALNVEAVLVHGRHPQLVTSMCFMEETLWWDGIHGFDNHPRTPDSTCLDDESSILTLTRSSLLETGLAAPIASLESFLAGLGLPSSITIQRLDRQMRESSRRLERVRRQLESGATLNTQEQALLDEISQAP